MGKKKKNRRGRNFKLSDRLSRFTLNDSVIEECVAYVFEVEAEREIEGRIINLVSSARLCRRESRIQEEMIFKLLRRLARELFERDRLYNFLRSYVHLCEEGAPNQQLFYLARSMGRVDQTLLRWHTRAMFCSHVKEAAGESLDRSCQFAVALFNGMCEFLELNEDPNIQPNKVLPCGMGLRIILETALTYPLSDRVDRRWLARIIQASRRPGEPREIFRKFLDCLILFRPNINIGALRVEPGSEIARSIEHCDTRSMLLDFSKTAELFLSPEEFEIYQTLLAEINQEGERYQQMGEEEIRWFLELEVRHPGIYDQLIRDLHEKLHRLLRPAGVDHLDIRVEALRNAGIETVSFHPEGHNPPDVDLCVYFRVPGRYLLCRTVRIRQGCFDPPEVVQGRAYHDPDVINRLFRYVVLDALHTIMVKEGKELPRLMVRRRPKGTSGQEVEEGWWVRPTLRKLLPGHKASQEALERAREAYSNPTFTLPEGKTFVKLHWQGGEVIYDRYTEPCLRYDRENLCQSPE